MTFLEQTLPGSAVFEPVSKGIKYEDFEDHSKSFST
jgi:hypothetical protein